MSFPIPRDARSTTLCIPPDQTAQTIQAQLTIFLPSLRTFSMQKLLRPLVRMVLSQMQTGCLPMCSKRLAHYLSMMMNQFLVPIWQLLRPEVERRVPIWGWVGAACGGGLGFIVANVPGLMLGAFAGNRLGAVRDAKGKSLAAVFSELSGNQRAEVSYHNRLWSRLDGLHF